MSHLMITQQVTVTCSCPGRAAARAVHGADTARAVLVSCRCSQSFGTSPAITCTESTRPVSLYKDEKVAVCTHVSTLPGS